MIIHPIPPVFDRDSRVLVLGSFPSVRSREANFFYGHPQNRFWKVASAVFGETPPITVEEKKAFMLRNHIAVWDVIGSCDIKGSADSSISNIRTNDIGKILKKSKIEKIYVNGRTAEKYYKKYLEEKTGMKAIELESSSPANARCSLEMLIEDWREKLGGQ